MNCLLETCNLLPTMHPVYTGAINYLLWTVPTPLYWWCIMVVHGLELVISFTNMTLTQRNEISLTLYEPLSWAKTSTVCNTKLVLQKENYPGLQQIPTSRPAQIKILQQFQEAVAHHPPPDGTSHDPHGKIHQHTLPSATISVITPIQCSQCLFRILLSTTARSPPNTSHVTTCFLVYLVLPT
jgi:hypothetical protein